MTRTGNHRNKAYLNFIRLQPCILSGQRGHEYDPVVAAHQSVLGDKGTSIKTSDYTTLPMLSTLHLEEHRLGHDTFWQQYPHIDLAKEIIKLNIRYIESKRRA